VKTKTKNKVKTETVPSEQNNDSEVTQHTIEEVRKQKQKKT